MPRSDPARDGFFLLPNLGAEEGPDWPRLARLPAVAATTRLWRFVFPAAHRLIGPIRGDEAWPDALGERPADAAFAWIDRHPGAHAWLCDDAAHAAAEAAGVPWAGPAPAIVQAVHDKAFADRTARALGLVPPPLRGLGCVLDAARLGDAAAAIARIEAEVARWPEWTAGRFVLKPRLGGSGRGRVAGALDDFDRRTLAGALPRLAERGGAILEPWLARTGDLSVALHVEASGASGGSGVTLLGSLESIVTPSGVPLGHAGEIDARGRVVSAHAEDERVREAAAMVAGAAREAGYFGPCGVDALSFRAPDLDGRARTWLRPVVELNARFTLGLVAIGLLRRLLGRLRAEHGLAPGERRGFCFALTPPAGHPDWASAARSIEGPALAVSLGAGDEPAGPGLLVAASRGALSPLVEPPAAGAADAARSTGA